MSYRKLRGVFLTKYLCGASLTFLALLAFLAVSTGSASAAEAPGMKVGYVDLPTLFYKSKMGLDYLEKYKKEYADKEKKLQPKEAELKSRLQRLEEQRSMMSPKSMKETQESLKAEMEQFQSQFKLLREELAKAEETYTKEVMEVVFDVVKDVAAKEKFDYVMEKRSLLFGGEDMTPKVMAALDGQYKGKKKK